MDGRGGHHCACCRLHARTRMHTNACDGATRYTASPVCVRRVSTDRSPGEQLPHDRRTTGTSEFFFRQLVHTRNIVVCCYHRVECCRLLRFADVKPRYTYIIGMSGTQANLCHACNRVTRRSERSSQFSLSRKKIKKMTI